MGSPVRPEQPADTGRVARNIAALRAQGASDDDVEAYLTQVEKLTPIEQPSLPMRVAHQVGGFAQQLLTHPISTAEQMVAQPVKSAIHAVLSPGVGEARPNPNLSKGGNSSGAPIGGTYDAEHGGITNAERNAAGLQTVANIAAPQLGGAVAGKLAGAGVPGVLAKTIGLATTGAPIGAAYSPSDPAAGAISGGLLTAVLGGGLNAGAKVANTAGSTLADVFGRPLESKPVQVGPINLGTVQGLRERATQLNADRLSRSGISAQNLSRQADATLSPGEPKTPPNQPTFTKPATDIPASVRQRSVDDVLAGIKKGTPPPPQFVKDFGAAYKSAQQFGQVGIDPNTIAVNLLKQSGKTYPAEPTPASSSFASTAASFGPSKFPLVRAANDMEIPMSEKGPPLSVIDLAGTTGQRMARGLKTASPAAETEIRSALEPRTEGAIERVINQAKDLTGIKRQNAYETHEALKQRTISEGDEAYGKVWGNDQGGMVTDPAKLAEIEKLKNKPAGEQAWGIAEKMMANDGVEAPAQTPVDLGYLKKLGLEKYAPQAQATTGPTLQQLHYWKLALDDLKQPGLDRGPGAGGIGYNMGKSILGVQKKLLGIMDDPKTARGSAAYADARAQYADNKAVENASEAGMQHWIRDPAESAAILNSMSPAEQRIYRDQAFDKWAERVENGPENVAKSQSKSLNTRRLRLLFPDDRSFGQFKQGLGHEAQMYASDKGALGGPNTADKFADMADMAGIDLPSVIKAARGNPIPLASNAMRSMMSERMRANADALALERSKQLSAGARGDFATRRMTLRQLAEAQAKQPQKGLTPLAGLLAPRQTSGGSTP